MSSRFGFRLTEFSYAIESAVELMRRDAGGQNRGYFDDFIMAIFVPRNAAQTGFLSFNAALDRNCPATVGVSSSGVMPLYFLTAEERDKFTMSKATLRLATSDLTTTGDFYAPFLTTNMTSGS
jgi:hypothetical protein